MWYRLNMSRTKDIDTRIGLNLRALRTLRRLEQKQIAAKMHDLGHATWAPSTVSQIERGQRAVLVSEALDLAGCLGVDLAKLLTKDLLST